MKCPAIGKKSIVHGNSLDLLKCIDNESVDLVVTSPPYADARKKHYNSIPPDGYKDWFLPFSREINRVLKPTGNFVLNFKEHVVDGARHPYVYDTVLAMVKDGWNWNDTYMWEKLNPLPRKPIRRFKDGWEHLYHFTKSKDFKFYPDRVTREVDNCKAYNNYIDPEYSSSIGPFGYYSRRHFAGSDCKKAYPSNVLQMAGAKGPSIHPARFPEKLPSFFIDVMSDPGDLVLDPFAGSGTTNYVAASKCRDTVGFDLDENYVKIGNDRLEKAACELKEEG